MSGIFFYTEKVNKHLNLVWFVIFFFFYVILNYMKKLFFLHTKKTQIFSLPYG